MKKFRLLVLVAFVMALLAGATTASAGSADNMYYWMSKLNSTEQAAVTGKAKGTVIVVYPTAQTPVVGAAAETLVKTNQVKIVTMAGVGSSSLGSAAFAKTIAVAKNVPVAGIVTGLGDDTTASEGYQGYFVGRPSNVAGVYYTEPASQKLYDLYVAGARPTMLVGHSKGDMDVANALYKLYNAGKQSLYQNVEVVTFGCGVNVPAGVGRFRQYLGNLDSLGAMNTVSYRNLTYVYGAYHTTNGGTYPWTYMPVQIYINK